MEIRAKQGLKGTITHTKGKWETRQLEESLKNLQEAADSNDIQPIWDFQNKLRMGKTSNRVAIKKQDGAECQGMEKHSKDGKNGPKNASAKTMTA